MQNPECVNAVIENIRRHPGAWKFLERADITNFGFVIALQWVDPNVTVRVVLLVMMDVAIADCRTLASLTIIRQGQFTCVDCSEEETTRLSQAVEHKVAVEKGAPHVATEDVTAISLVTTLMKD